MQIEGRVRQLRGGLHRRATHTTGDGGACATTHVDRTTGFDCEREREREKAREGNSTFMY